MFNTRMVEPYRIRTGTMASDESYGCNGQFMLPVRRSGSQLKLAAPFRPRASIRIGVQISDGLG